MNLTSRLAHRMVLLFAMGAVIPFCSAQSSSAKDAGTFPPLQKWKAAVIGGNAAALKALYSATPPPQIGTPSGATNADADAAFWIGLKARQIKLDIVQSDSPQPGAQQIVFQAEVQPFIGETVYVSSGQLWQKQGEQWRLVASKRSEPSRLQQPTSTKKEIYAPGVDAHAEIKHALAQATRQHKRVLVVFGANWCYDCHVLDLAFHRPDVEAVLTKNYEVVHVDVGEGDKNQDLMQRYQVPMNKGIPAIAVLDSEGKLLYSQKGGEFEKARALTPEDVLAFLNKWKPGVR